MSAEPTITQAEMDKYFETGGKEAPAALVEAEKVEAATPPPDLQDKPIEADKPVETKPVEQPKEAKPDGEVQVQVEGKTVPLSELISERKARQAWEQTAATQQQQLSEMLKMVQERAKTMTPAETQAAPDPNTDPFGYINHVLSNVQATTNELQQWKQQQTQLTQAQTQSNQVLNWANQQAASFKTKTPDYDDALKFAEQARFNELKAATPWASDEQIHSIIDSDKAQLVMAAAQRTMQGFPTNPAELAYNYSKAKGYKIVAEQKKVPDLDDKVNTITRGQEAAKGVSNTSGGAPSEINNLQDLAAASGDMDDETFAKAFDKLAGKMKGKYV